MVLPPRSQTTETLVHTQDIDLRTWIGRSETLRDTFASAPVRALTATLDHAPLPVTHGMPLPPLWHWLYFLPMHRQSDIGPDGHAMGGQPIRISVAGTRRRRGRAHVHDR
jgi:3-methylfumaryl-CoA hydratase